MYVLISMFFLVAAMLTACLLLIRRMHSQVRELIASHGGTYVSCLGREFEARCFDVKYIAPEGDLRQAIVSVKGKAQVLKDQPYQNVLREKRERASSMMDELRLHVECSRLPGYEAFKVIISEFSRGVADGIVVDESAAPATNGRQFVPLLQVAEAECILSKPGNDQVLDFVADGKPILVRWEVTGQAPHRSLLLTALR